MKKFIRIFAGVFLVTVLGTVSVFADQNDVVPTVAFRDDGGSNQQPSAESKAEAEAKYIKSQIANIKIGSRIAFEEALYSKAKTTNLVAAVVEWQAACVAILTNQQIMGAENIQTVKSHEGGKIVYTCEITKCYENSFDLSADKKTCVKKNTDTTKLDNKPIVPINTGDSSIVSSKAHEILMIANDSVTGIVGSQIIFTDDEATNKEVSDAINTWEHKCKFYTIENISLDVDSTYVKKDKGKKKNNVWRCLIDKCKDDTDASGKVKKMEPTEDGKACVATNGKKCTSSDKHADVAIFNITTNNCEIKTCKNGWQVSADKSKCEKTKRVERAAKKAETKLEKEFESDMKKLRAAYDKVVKQLTTECEKNKGKITDGICETPTK